jgi:hypothetical protein
MSTELHDDLLLVTEGSLTRAELVSRHGHDAASLIDLHTQFAELSSVAIEPPPWYAIAPALGLDPRPAKRSRRRMTIISIAAAFVLVPVAAEALEAVAPEAVRGTVIDRITDVLPWDTDLPVEDPLPFEDQDQPPVTDNRSVDVNPDRDDARETISDRIARGDRERLRGDRDNGERSTDTDLKRPGTTVAPTRDGPASTADVDRTSTTVADAPTTTSARSDTSATTTTTSLSRDRD